MDKKWFEIFADRAKWDDLVQTYIKTGTAPGKLPFSHVSDLWDYFKFCILTDNRFFFDHPLLDVVKAKVGEHVITLPINTTLFRARIDTNDSLSDQARNLMQVDILTELKEKETVPGKAEVDKMIARFTGVDGYDAYREQHQCGFEGFSADECMCPPPHKVSHGRCNLPNSPHLYAAADIHTAIAETRPYIRDTISVASLCCKKDLRIIDFCFDWDDQDHFRDWFYMAMSSEFSDINKGKENDYFATQYLSMLVKSMGYDGLRFKSSLVIDGINYVIFDETACKPISSKLYTAVQARYDVLPVSIDSHLKDSAGSDIDNPPLSR
ncbi:RES family NAD+ phosphorylase [uncultured Ruminococcus sp.]|uniref:RES family NAD+ phosphorylase n=1 Tax=uncultured Ruminococcus sp. TaxID=165186 RepID=UPI0025E41EC0|nr:RES family NAD+ phosphorylase [uncultured Ruminococcus sp.]